MGKLLTTAIFILSLLFTGHAFGKSNEYYQQTLIYQKILIIFFTGSA